jgi:hypothetical protein
MTTMRDVLNAANPNTLADAARAVALGNVLAGQYRVVQAVPVSDAVILPNEMKIGTLVSVLARAGTGTPGPCTLDAVGATPAVASHVAATFSGDLVCLAADAWTSVEIVYQPVIGDVVSLVGARVTANVLAAVGCRKLISAIGYTALGVPVALTQITPGAVAAGQVAMSLSQEQINFAAADAIVSCDIVYVKAPTVELGAALDTDATIL